MRISKLTSVIGLSAFLLAASACSSPAAPTPPLTRAATQTPWIIYVNQTSTPEPATVTPLPTVAVAAAPTRTATKSAARPTATKAPPTKVPATAGPTNSPVPVCSYGPVTLKEPDVNASRQTKEIGIGGDTFRFIWDPPDSLGGPGDPTVGYQLTVSSKRSGFTAGVVYYVSNNKFLSDGKIVIMDKPVVSGLASGAAVTVSWFVTVVKTSGSFNDLDPNFRPPGLVSCGPPSETRYISLGTF